jgi:glycosyltransferase involved in cell wall biosynthesis
MNPTITVLIDTYNHERFIEEAIVSALEQDFPRAGNRDSYGGRWLDRPTPEIVRKFHRLCV